MRVVVRTRLGSLLVRSSLKSGVQKTQRCFAARTSRDLLSSELSKLAGPAVQEEAKTTLPWRTLRHEPLLGRNEMNEVTISDIRLGWLQRFSAVARCQSLAAAGRECGVDPTALSDSIQRLEEALHRPLVAPATARLTATGRAFIGSAEKILELSRLSDRASGNVSIGSFQSLIAMSENETYSEAATSSGRTRFKIARGISELEYWIGDSIVYYRDIVRLTAKGEDILPVAREIIKILEKWRDLDNDLRRDKSRNRVKPWWLRYYGPAEVKVR